MNTLKQLARIRARCVELLAGAENRTQGKWQECGRGHQPQGCSCGQVWSLEADAPVCTCNDRWGDGTEGTESWMEYGRLGETDQRANALFIASCAGAAEAGWRSTIVAIDGLGIHDPALGKCSCNTCAIMHSIIAAWPEELL